MVKTGRKIKLEQSKPDGRFPLSKFILKNHYISHY